MKQKLKTLKWADFDKFNPSYSLWEYYGDFSGTILDILNHPEISNNDKLWAFSREGVMDDKTLRLFAVRCARNVQHLMADQRSIDALDVAERYANGLATYEELAKARKAAWDVAWDAEGEAAWAARAAWDATWEVAGDAAWEAAEAARVSAKEAARAAARAARSVWAVESREGWKAWETEGKTQVQMAIELINQFYEI